MRRLVVFVALGGLLQLPAAGSDNPYSGPPLEVDYDGPILVDNSQYRYTAPDRLSFSTADLLTATYPDIQPLRPAIDSWASRLGIHPKVLSAVVYSYFSGSQVLGDTAEIDTVVQIASALATVYSGEFPNPLAASRAVKATADALTFALQLPPGLAASRELELPIAGAPAPALFGYLQPPWEIGETWAGGGAHGTSHNALDFWGPYQSWGGDTSPYWVVAMQGGTVRVRSSCNVEVIHPNGWITGYYHLDNVQVADFATVERNDRLANYADNITQALCQGGSSSGPHVHMSIRYNGDPVSVDQANVDFTAFSHHAGEGNYDTDCSRSWYDHFTAGRICPNYRQLLNDAPLPGIFIDRFEAGDTTAWSVTRGFAEPLPK